MSSFVGDPPLDSSPNVNVSFRLAPAALDVAVDVVLRRVGERWLSVADAGGESSIGVGGSARKALRASLGSFGPRSASTLMADPALFAVSQQVLCP